MQEIWKPITYNSEYLISNQGNVKRGEKIIKGWVQNTGYRTICIGRKKYSVHRLVAETFLDNPNNYPIINHKDGNKQNNCVDNLEWCTYKHNINEAQKIGLYDKRNKNMSVNPLRSKKIKLLDKNSNKCKVYKNMKEASISLGYNPSYISHKIVKGKFENENFKWEVV